jgi:hypothetical protein
MENLMTPTDGEKLTTVQKQRYDYLFPIYGELSYDIARSITGKGKNSWQSFLDKMDIVTRAKSRDKEYYDALYEQFSLGELYTSSDIVGHVGEVRRDLELSPYIDKLKVRSEYDFFLVFMTEDIHDEVTDNGKIKKVLKGHKPLIKVKPE